MTKNNDCMDFEVRFSDVGEAGEVEGVAVRFNTVDNYRSEFAPEAFRGLEGRSVPMLWSHDPANVIGSWSTFQVRNDGLVAKGKLNLSVAKALEVRSLVAAGDVKGLSIGFRTEKDERRANGVRRILEARLIEISIVAFPAVPGSGITKVRHENSTGKEAAAAFIAACQAATRALKGN
ncbi:HK97 family phage prohead protease [Rhizobium sp. P32RR-XVIII]|uniref:HK97 family phage prohead protease n=1 Tax=Rhizobium sp. P32RR-XVIII TaxID=2726738 RepID=UPI0014573799|nr:HK97 family phage prohead protease [Rhizobium sp. P32RR-XVIII]NLS04604.1 HK97 family phage prohead protease [Rhizobium sp. P32RR-XVIII]